MRIKESNEKGVTMLALVITIIVLLLLAGVTIHFVFGKNGILSNAQEAKEKMMEEASKEEELYVKNFENWINGVVNGTPSTSPSDIEVVSTPGVQITP